LRLYDIINFDLRFSIFITIFLIVSCSTENNIKKELILSGRVAEPAEYLILEKDTIHINQGVFLDTISQEKSQYKYIKLSSWKWPRIIYLETGETYSLHFDSNYFLLIKTPF